MFNPFLPPLPEMDALAGMAVRALMEGTIQKEREGQMKITVFFAWYDLWIGAYWNRTFKVLYICPLPMIVIRISFKGN